MSDRHFVCLLLGPTLLLAACKKPEIQSYRVPKETTPVAASPAPTGAGGGAGGAIPAAASAPMAGNGMANTAVATANGPGLTWTAPANWTEKPPGPMRRGSYAVKVAGMDGEADLSITAFPGEVGGELANVNRWRGQIQLAPVSPAELASTMQRIERNGLKIAVADLRGTGPDPRRLLGAMVPHGGATWFFKLGPAADALIEKEKPAFLAFLDTIKPAAQ